MFALVKNETVTNPQDGTTSDVKVIKLFSPYTVWEDNTGVQHSPEFLFGLNAGQKQDLGIYDVAYESRPDDRFYTITENAPQFDAQMKVVKVTFTSTAKPLDSEEGSAGLKQVSVEQVKTTSNNLLTQTDWMLVRKIERDIDVPTATATYRAAVVAEANRLEAAINAATDVEELIAAVQSANWPAAE